MTMCVVIGAHAHATGSHDERREIFRAITRDNWKCLTIHTVLTRDSQLWQLSQH